MPNPSADISHLDGLIARLSCSRDPCIFEEDGKYLLFYSIAGEAGIAMAEITLDFGAQPSTTPRFQEGEGAR